MKITRMPGTQHIGVDMARLKAFLEEQHFEPEIINELEIVLVPMPAADDIDDTLYDEYPDDWTQFLACGGKDAPTIQRELLAQLRVNVIEEANAPWGNEPAERSWKAWEEPDVYGQDAQLFAASAPTGLIFFDNVVHPLEETDVVSV